MGIYCTTSQSNSYALYSVSSALTGYNYGVYAYQTSVNGMAVCFLQIIMKAPVPGFMAERTEMSI